MKRSLFQLPLWWLVALIFVAALDCAVLRFPLPGRPLPLIMVLIGVLPMANLLVLGPLVTVRQGGSQLAFWAGFEIAGLLALLFYGAGTIHHSQDLREVVLGVLRSVSTPVSLTFPAAAAVLLLPELVLALIGALLSEFIVSRVRMERDAVGESGRVVSN